LSWGRAALGVLRDLVHAERVRAGVIARGEGVRLARTVEIRSPHQLVLGDHVFVDSGVLLHCGGMEWCPGGGIRIGAHSYVGPRCVLFGAGGIEIGESALISPGVVITSHQHTITDAAVDVRLQPIRFGPVVIERNVWIGANAVVLPGVRIGEGSVIGAGAVVNRDVPPGVIAVGVPAKVKLER